jgi:hypothetical protein
MGKDKFDKAKKLLSKKVPFLSAFLLTILIMCVSATADGRGAVRYVDSPHISGNVITNYNLLGDIIIIKDGKMIAYNASIDSNASRWDKLEEVYSELTGPATIILNGHFQTDGTPLEPKSGISIESSGPEVVTLDTNTTAYHPACGDKWSFGAGGTLIEGITGDETVFSGNATPNDVYDISINNFKVRNIGFKNVGKVFDVGAANHTGFFSCVLENIYVNGTNDTAFNFGNFQFLTIRNIRMRDVNGGIFGYSQHKYFAGGNSQWDDIMIIPRANSPYGIKLGAYNTPGSNGEGQLNFISGSRWQINAFSGLTATIQANLVIEGTFAKRVQHLNLSGLDLEGSYSINKLDATYMDMSNIGISSSNHGTQTAMLRLRNSSNNVITSSDNAAYLDFDSATCYKTMAYGVFYDVNGSYMPNGLYRLYNSGSTLAEGVKLVGAGFNGTKYRIDVSPGGNPWLAMNGFHLVSGTTNRTESGNITKWDNPRITVNNSTNATMTLQTAAGVGDMEFSIVKTSDSAAGNKDVTIAVQSGEYLNGTLNGTIVITGQNQLVLVRSDGIQGWMVIGRNYTP